MPAIPRSLLEHLHELAESSHADIFACVTARREHGVKSATMERPTLAILLRGQKHLRNNSVDVHLRHGDLFLVSRACQLDAVNRPDPDTGLYLTLLIPLCEEVIQAARLLWSAPVTQGGEDVVAVRAERFEAELLSWCQALQAGRYGQARLALAAILVHFCESGHTTMLVPPPPAIAAQVRAIVAAQPARDWLSRDFEDTLGLSGATLRRRLAAEGSSLRTAITEARLACALELLYTTRWPVKTVAARVGYRSVTSFVQRFVARYGLEPRQIGNV